MSREFIENSLYKPFTQENGNVRTQYQGTGLGMAIVYELVERMRGTIEVDSELRKGTTFTVILPFKVSDSPVENISEERCEKDIEGMRILVAEDNLLNREIIEAILEEAGAIVTTAGDGQEVLDIFESSEENKFDAILMDIMMPVFDGLEATRRIRDLDREDAKKFQLL